MRYDFIPSRYMVYKIFTFGIKFFTGRRSKTLKRSDSDDEVELESVEG